MSSIVTNKSALTALTTLRSVSMGLDQTQSRISTGYRVATAKDNAAYFAIAQTMRGDIAAFTAMTENLDLSNSLTAVARGASEQITDLMNDIKSKIIAAQADGVDRGQIQAEINDFIDQIAMVGDSAQFNGATLLKSNAQKSFSASLNRGANGSTTGKIVFQQTDLTDRGAVLTAQNTVNNTVAGQSTITIAGFTDNVQGQVTELKLQFGTSGATNANQTFTYDLAGLDTSADIAAELQTRIREDTGISGLMVTTTGAGVFQIGNGGSAGEELTGTTDIVNAVAVTRGSLNNLNFNASDTQGATTSGYVYVGGLDEGQAGEVGTIAIDGGTAYNVSGEDSIAGMLNTLVDNGDITSASYDSTSGFAYITGATDLSTLTFANTRGSQGVLRELQTIDVVVDGGADTALAAFEVMLERAVGAAQTFGSVQNRIDVQNEFVKTLRSALETGVGALVDADMNAESARLQALQVQQQLAVQALSIANSQPQNILALFR